jgi:RNA polymerase sigma-70 factor (ECF subfamily)
VIEPQVVRSMLEEGQQAWPSVRVEETVFAAYLDARAAAGPLHAPDLYLACACSRGDERAIGAFETYYLCEVADFLAGSRPTPELVEDVRQRLRVRLFVERKLEQYSGRSPLGRWLRVVTIRVAANMRQQERPHADLDEALPAAAIDPELAVIQRRFAAPFRTALAAAVAELSAEERSVLRLHYLDGLSIDRIGLILLTSRATVGRRMIAAREHLVRNTRRILQERLRVTTSEIQSLFRLVRHELASELGAVLRGPPAG